MVENTDKTIKRLQEVAPTPLGAEIERKGRDGAIRRPNIVPPTGPGGITPISPTTSGQTGSSSTSATNGGQSSEQQSANS